ARAQLSRRLPGGVVPMLTIVDELPVKTSGKVDRKALPWPIPSAETTAPADLSTAELWLRELWMDQLGPLPISAGTNFFEIGGGSVQVARLMADIRKRHSSAEIRELYANPTLAGMARYLATLEAVSAV